MAETNWPQRGEWRESERRGFTALSAVESDYEIRAGVVRRTSSAHTVSRYLPILRANEMRDALLQVARASAKATEVGVLGFVERFGLLGYSRVYDPVLKPPANGRAPRVVRSGEYDGGDPLDWFRAHAEGVRTVVELLDWLKHGPPRNQEPAPLRHRATRTPRTREKAAMPGLPTRWIAEGQFIRRYLEPWLPDVMTVPSQDARRAIDDACRMISEIVERNLGGVRRTILWKQAPEQRGSRRRRDPQVPVAEIGLTAGSVEAVWWSMADFVAGGTTLRCDECHSVFVQSHRAQRFCRGIREGAESPCAVRHRQNRWRERQKQRS